MQATGRHHSNSNVQEKEVCSRCVEGRVMGKERGEFLYMELFPGVVWGVRKTHPQK